MAACRLFAVRSLTQFQVVYQAQRPFCWSAARLRASNEDSPQSNSWKDDSPIPAFTLRPLPRPDEPLANMKRRLYYESRKRGILENDLLLCKFADKHLDQLSLGELELYDELLDENDWDIYYWATGNRQAPEKYQGRVLELIQEIAKNKERVILRQASEPKSFSSS